MNIFKTPDYELMQWLVSIPIIGGAINVNCYCHENKSIVSYIH